MPFSTSENAPVVRRAHDAREPPARNLGRLSARRSIPQARTEACTTGTPTTNDESLLSFGRIGLRTAPFRQNESVKGAALLRRNQPMRLGIPGSMIRVRLIKPCVSVGYTMAATMNAT